MAKVENKILLNKANEIVKLLRDAGGKFYIAGSVRRKVAEIGDIDIVVLEKDLTKLQEIAVKTGKPIIRQYDEEIIGCIIDDVRVEFYVTSDYGFGAMMLYTTGSKWFNIKQRAIAKAKGFKLNQYGLWKDEVRVAVTEEGIFGMLEMKYVEPEGRK